MAPSILKRATRLAQLRPGAWFLIAGPEAPDLALLVVRDGELGAVMLNRRGDQGHLAHVTPLAADAEVLALPGAFLAPGGAVTDIARGGTVIAPAALHLGADVIYLCGRDRSGWLTPFDARTGRASAIDLAALPHVTRWRLMVPGADGGLITLYAAEPA